MKRDLAADIDLETENCVELEVAFCVLHVQLDRVLDQNGLCLYRPTLLNSNQRTCHICGSLTQCFHPVEDPS